MIIDTHCHLDDTCYDSDLSQVVQNAHDNGVKKMIIAGADTADLPRAVQIAEKNAGVYFAVGAHPYNLSSFDEKIFERYATHEKCVAIGECGLDYYRKPDDAEKAEQKRIFEAQISLAVKFKKPLIVHIRDANEDAFEILNRRKSELTRGGVLHCFNASPLLLGLSDTFFYGIGGVLTFKNAKSLVAILPQIPRDKLVLETDAPYLTPEPFRGTRNEPARTALVAKKMAELLSLDEKEVRTLTTQNAQRLFAI